MAASHPWSTVGVFSFLALAMAGLDEGPGIPPPDTNTETRGRCGTATYMGVVVGHVCPANTTSAAPDVAAASSSSLVPMATRVFTFHYMHTGRETTLLSLRPHGSDTARGECSFKSTTRSWSGFHGSWTWDSNSGTLIATFRWNAMLPLVRHRFQRVENSACATFRDADMIRTMVDVDCDAGINELQWRR